MATYKQPNKVEEKNSEGVIKDKRNRIRGKGMEEGGKKRQRGVLKEGDGGVELPS